MNTRQVVTLTPAYMLHARPYRDSSVIAEFFTKDYGRVALVARGARRPKSKSRSSLRPFAPVFLSWTKRGSLGTLTAIEPATASSVNLGKRLLSAYYVNELILRALKPGDSHAELFSLYDDLLVQIEQASEESVVLRFFELKMLELLGYGLPLSHDSNGQPVEEHASYQFNVSNGFTVLLNNSDQVGYSGKTLLSLAAGELSDRQTMNEAKGLLRHMLDLHLGEHSSKVRDVLSSMHSRKQRWVSRGDSNNKVRS